MSVSDLAWQKKISTKKVLLNKHHALGRTSCYRSPITDQLLCTNWSPIIDHTDHRSPINCIRSPIIDHTDHRLRSTLSRLDFARWSTDHRSPICNHRLSINRPILRIWCSRIGRTIIDHRSSIIDHRSTGCFYACCVPCRSTIRSPIVDLTVPGSKQVYRSPITDKT